jgi:hypothetical protein
VALVVFLKGINVGGHRRFRPTLLAEQLRRRAAVRDIVSVGAAGTFVVRGRMHRADLRAEIRRRLPFEAEVMICRGVEVLDLTRHDPFVGQPAGHDVVRFVSAMPQRLRRALALPTTIPTRGPWGVRVLDQRGPFVLGLYRRQMKAIGYLGQLESSLGVPLATRSWSTIISIVSVLEA